METAEQVKPPRIDGAALLSALRSVAGHHPIAIREKMAFLNLYCNADAVAITASAQVYEYEVKATRADFLRDARKLRHRIYMGEMRGRLPNRFWYATAPGIIAAPDLPQYAGWYELSDGELVERVPAPLLWRGRHEHEIILQCAEAMKRRPL